MEQHYATLDWTSEDDANRFLTLVELVLRRLDFIAEHEDVLSPEDVERDKQRIFFDLRHAGWDYADGSVIARAPSRRWQRLSHIAEHVGAPVIEAQLRRIHDEEERDPALAIGTAKELIETVAKTILSDLGTSLTGNEDVPQLVKAVRKRLALTPEDVPENVKGREIVTRTLESLAQIAQGLAELRGLYGTGHGPDGKARGLQPRHARLAVNSSIALAVFLLETWQERKAFGRRASTEQDG